MWFSRWCSGARDWHRPLERRLVQVVQEVVQELVPVVHEVLQELVLEVVQGAAVLEERAPAGLRISGSGFRVPGVSPCRDSLGIQPRVG